jgi:ubiquinone biosynthesis protein
MLRLLNITYVIFKYDLEIFLSNYTFYKVLNLGTRIKRLFIKKIDAPLEKRLRYALEELGPVFIKLGQLLASRSDLLPHRFLKELESLHDDVSSEHIDFLDELGEKKKQFKYINFTPIASASIAQVYEGFLTNNEEVVLKVLKPKSEKIIKEDLELFKNLISVSSKYISEYKSNVLYGILSELELSLLQEINFEKEVENAELFRKNMSDFSNIIIPKIYKELCTKNIIVMEKVYGTPINQIDELKSKNLDLVKVSEQGLEILMIQILRNRFFHADLHPGNIWIDDIGNRIFLDFGIMGTLSKEDRDMLSDMIANLYIKNYENFIELQIQSGWVDKTLNKTEYLNEIKQIFELKNFSKSLNDIFKMGEKFGIKVPVHFLLLVKTLMITESSAKRFNSNIDIGIVGSSILLKHFKEHIKFSKGS